MGKIYITGDCHGDFRRFGVVNFPEQKEMTRDDFVIVCGDFGGIWNDSHEERYWNDWLASKPFTVVFIDGNHENFDRLTSEFPIVDFHGGKAHKIRDNIYHLMRGYVFEFNNKTFFAFGGAQSHDIKDGIIEPDDFASMSDVRKEFRRRTRNGEYVRVNHISWWKEEMPTPDEITFGREQLAKHQNHVDFVITHCAPQRIVNQLPNAENYAPDALTSYFDKISSSTEFSKWFFGHYHDNKNIDSKFILLYEQIIRVA